MTSSLEYSLFKKQQTPSRAISIGIIMCNDLLKKNHAQWIIFALFNGKSETLYQTLPR